MFGFFNDLERQTVGAEGSNALGILRLIPMVLLSAGLLVGLTVPAFACGCGPGEVFVPDPDAAWPCKKVEANRSSASELILTIDNLTFGADPATASGCGMAVGLPIGGPFISVESVDIRDRAGNRVSGFAGFEPNRTTGDSFGRRIADPSFDWSGMFSHVVGEIPDKLPSQINVTLKVDPKASDRELFSALKWLALAVDGADSNGASNGHHLLYVFGYPVTVPDCVDLASERVCRFLDGDERGACVEKAPATCYRQFDQ